jgi:hypothetical protein
VKFVALGFAPQRPARCLADRIKATHWGNPPPGWLPSLANEKAAFGPLFALCDLRHSNIRDHDIPAGTDRTAKIACRRIPGAFVIGWL